MSQPSKDALKTANCLGQPNSLALASRLISVLVLDLGLTFRGILPRGRAWVADVLAMAEARRVPK